MVFVCSNDDPVFVSGKSGRLQPDVGATLHAVEMAANRQAIRVGKPEIFCKLAIFDDYFKD